MKCCVCLMDGGVVKEMVGLCRFCGVAVCATHFADAADAGPGGMVYTCRHPSPAVADVPRAEAALAAIGSTYVAACKHCGLGLTPRALAELADQSQGGMHYRCNHPLQPR